MNKNNNKSMVRIFLFNSYANQLIICLVNIKRNIWVFYSLSTAKRHIVIIDSLFYHYKRLQAMKKGTKTKGAIENNRKIQIKCLFCFLLFPSFPHLRTLHRYLFYFLCAILWEKYQRFNCVRKPDACKMQKTGASNVLLSFHVIIIMNRRKKKPRQSQAHSLKNGKKLSRLFFKLQKFSIINLLGRMKREREKKNVHLYACCIE